MLRFPLTKNVGQKKFIYCNSFIVILSKEQPAGIKKKKTPQNARCYQVAKLFVSPVKKLDPAHDCIPSPNEIFVG